MHELFNNLPPHDNKDADQAVIGSVMLTEKTPQLQRKLLAMLKEHHFLTPQHGQVWSAIMAVAARGEPLVGDPGAGKTVWLMQCVNHWVAEKMPAAALVLEKDRAWHNRRCLALIEQDLRLLDDEAVRDKPAWYTSRPGEHADTLDASGRCIWDSTQCGSSLEEIAAWIDQQADAGARVIVVDPVSLADTTQKPWEAHDVFMRSVRRSIERTGASLVLVTHPRGGQKQGPPTINDLAGSMVFVRRADSILWLRAFPVLRSATCARGLGESAMRNPDYVDRTIRVLKCRDGSAAGLDFGLQWHKTAGGFRECGIVEEWLNDGVVDGPEQLPEGL